VKQTVLVALGDLAACRTTSRILREAGFECISATTGEHVMALLVDRTEAPDLFLFDVRLPDMPGPTLAWLICQRYGEMPGLFISGHSSFDASLLSAGAWDFLAMPFSPESLVASVTRLTALPDVRARTAS
jgi:DNA-binding NtrC family response regulator